MRIVPACRLVAAVVLVLVFAAAAGAALAADGAAARAVLVIPEGGLLALSVPDGGRGVRLEVAGGAYVESLDAGLDKSEETLDGDRRLLTIRPAGPDLRFGRVERQGGRLRLVFEAAGGPAVASEVSEEYRLGPRDKIHVSVYDHPELTVTLQITEAGLVDMPLIGEVPVAGRTVTEAARVIEEALGRDYVVDPQVSILVEEYASQWVMLTGAVRTPGKYILKGGTRLREVLAEAGGFLDSAGESIVVHRPSAPAGPMRIEVTRQAVEQGSEDPLLRHGDSVHVEEAAYCYVLGEVRSPTRMRATPDLTLLQAISLAGGLTQWARKKDVQILRNGGGAAGEVYDLRAIEAGRLPDPPLRGGEVVLVKRRKF